MRKRLFLFLILALLLVFSLSGCIPGDGKATAENPAGFFWGIWHGWVAPISLIVSIFNRDIRIYETFNNGWFYDFGYYMAVISGFGGLSLGCRKRRQSGG